MFCKYVPHNTHYLIKKRFDSKNIRERILQLDGCKNVEKVIVLVRGVGFEPTQAYAIGASALIKNVSRKNVSPVMEGLIVTDSGKLDEFLKWCLGKGTSYETCIQYVNYLRKPLNRNNKWSVLAYKAYFKFTRNEDLWKKIRTKQSRPDLNVPTDQEVLETLETACSYSQELCLVFKLLIESGARLAEIVKMLREFDPGNLKEHSGFYTYTLSYFRGSKRSFYIFTITKPRKLVISGNWVSNWASKNGKVRPKYVRKWVATRMAYLEIPMEIVDFIQGRVPRTILEKHYLNLYALALKHYPKYAKWLKENILEAI